MDRRLKSRQQMHEAALRRLGQFPGVSQQPAKAGLVVRPAWAEKGGVSPLGASSTRNPNQKQGAGAVRSVQWKL